MRAVSAILLSALAACVNAEAVDAPGEAPPPLVSDLPAPPGEALVVPTGFAAGLAAGALVDPRAIAFDAEGAPVVVEGEPARLSRVGPTGELMPIATGGGNGPWTGVARQGRHFYVAEAGGSLGGRLLRVGPDGGVVPVTAKLPVGGVLGPLASGPDGALYLGVATAAAGDAAARDIPCQDIRLRDGDRIKGAVPCTGSVLRIDPGDGAVSVYAWGFTNPVGIAFAPDGKLLVADDVRLPASVQQTAAIGDPVWEASPGIWYGWPDFAGQTALADPDLAVTPNPPPPPLATLDGEVAAVAASDRPEFGGANQAFVAVATGDGGRIDAVARDTGEAVPFAANLARPGPMAFTPDGSTLLVADAESGALWRVVPFR